MAEDEREPYERLVRRIELLAAAFGAAGLVVTFAAGGWRWAAGFGLGAAASWVSFRWLKQMVAALGGTRPPRRLAAKAVLRYLLIAGGVYVIVKIGVVNLRAALAGLFLSTAAVLAELLLELIHSRN